MKETESRMRLKVFISWSGPRSKQLASELAAWLEQVLQLVRPWMSATDIHVGDRWASRLEESLAEHDVGVICVTPENRTAMWLQYEAGALSKAVGRSRVCPLLFQLAPRDLADNPLSQFQAATADREGLFKLVSSLNDHLGEDRISDDILRKAFDGHWPEFERTIVRLETLETAYDPAYLPSILEVFARRDFPSASISATAFFRDGFESHQLYDLSTSAAKHRLYNYSRLNRKLMDKEHRDFFSRLPVKVAGGFELKLLFLNPNAPEHVIRSAHKDANFRDQIMDSLRNAIGTFKHFGLEPDVYCRTYETERPVAMTIIDDAVMFSRVKVDETGVATAITKSSFAIVHSRSDLGADLLDEFNSRWATGLPISESL